MFSARAFVVDTPVGQRTLAAWLFFHITGGQVLLPLLLLTFAATRVKRHAIFVSLCITWVMTSILASMLWYRHRSWYNGPEAVDLAFDPVCLAQASLLHHAVPPMVSCSAFALIFHVWTRVRTTVKPEQPSTFVTLRTVALVVCPYIAWAVFGIAASVIVLSNIESNPGMVRLGLYCELQHVVLARVRGVFTMLVLFATAFYEARIIARLCRKSTSQMDAVERALFIRVVAFGAYVLIGFVLSIVSMFIATAAPDVYIATVPFIIFGIFGFQQDVLKAWCFWKRMDLSLPMHVRRPSLTPLRTKDEAT